MGGTAGISVVLAKHENCAGFMGEGVHHRDRAPAILVATIGPGIANAANVIANCFQDRVPMVALSHGGECAFDRVGGAQMLPMLGGKVVERQHRLAILDQACGRLVVLDGAGLDEGVEGAFCVVPGLGLRISWRARFAFECWLLGSLLSTLAVLCTQQRWLRVRGHTSSIAFQKPSPPSAMASSGATASPRRLRSSSSSRHDWALSRTPSMRPTSSFLPSGVAPMMTSRHCASSSSRACTWMPSAQK